MDEIRVTYTGLISLVLGIFSIVIGLGFNLIITRNLSEVEYGTWGIIGGLLVYATIVDPVITFWTTREIARNEESGKTAVFTGMIFSSIGLVIYFISAIILSYSTDVDQKVVFLGMILIPLIVINNILAAITLGWKPQGFSFGRIVLGLVQIPLGILFIMMLEIGTAGVIYAVAIATLTSIFYFIAYNRKKLRNSVQRKFIKKWIKFSWVSLYPNIGGVIKSLDVMIFSVITGSVIGIAFWTATQIILTVTASSQLVSTATYSKLLQGGDKEFIKENVRLLIYFTVLFVGITITFAEHGLFLLNPTYANAAIIVIIMAVGDFMWIISNKLLDFVQGVDKVDMNKESTVQDYFKSSLINIPTLRLIHSIAYISSLTIVLLITFSSENSNLEMLIYWAILAMILEIPVIIYSIFIFHKKIHLKNDYRYILKYTFASVISFGGVYVIMKDIIEFNTKIIEFLPQVLVFVIISVLIYIGITYAIDNKTRLLVKSITKEMKN